jgi:hypothetical protein
MPRIIPPHNPGCDGFGREEDALNNVKYLVYEYKRPPFDFYKFMDKNIILRFKARLVTKIIED